ncbi:MAG: hypothetical protein APF76_02505 [Desulfitibacter sp. BRH_c19]|nr:MAG: hypothetical protein APF76_02505 [Desulfitibacter sp. BRH_c19]
MYTKNIKYGIGLITVLMLITFSITLIILADSQDDLNQKEKHWLSDIENISIKTSLTEVEIIPTNSDYLEAVYYENPGKTNQKARKLTIKEKSNTLLISLEGNIINSLFNFIQRWSNFTGRSESHLTIYVPEDYYHALSVNSSSGSIIVRDLELNRITLSSSSGNINVDQTGASLSAISSSSGAITVSRLTSDETTVRSSSGKIIIKEFVGNQNLHSSSGSSQIEFDMIGNFHARASSGNINVFLPEDSEFKIHSRVSSGQYSNEFPVRITHSSRNNKEIAGTVGKNPTELIDLRTSSGSISVRKGR